MPKSYLKKNEIRKMFKNIVFIGMILAIITFGANYLLIQLISNNTNKLKNINYEISNDKYIKSEDIFNRLLAIENNILLINNADNEIKNYKFNLEKIILVILYALDNNILLESMSFSKDDKSFLLNCVTDNNLYSDDFIAKLNKHNGFKKVSFINFENSNKIYFTIEVILDTHTEK